MGLVPWRSTERDVAGWEESTEHEVRDLSQWNVPRLVRPENQGVILIEQMILQTVLSRTLCLHESLEETSVEGRVLG